MAGRIVSHASATAGQLSISLPRSAVATINVVGVDLVLTLTDGSQHVLQGAALQAMAPARPSM